MNKQIVFEKYGIEIWNDGFFDDGWYVSSIDNEYVVYEDEGMYHLAYAEDFRNEPPLVENICSYEDNEAYEKIISAVIQHEILEVLHSLSKEAILNHTGERILKNWDYMPETRDGLEYAFLGQSQKHILNSLSISSLVGADEERAIEEFVSENEVELLNMEFRTAKVQVRNPGGNASKGARSYSMTLPASWMKLLGVTDDDREVKLSFDGRRVIIEK